MTTFTELYNLTVELTKRPELVAMTKLAVKTATKRAHCTDFFHRDGYATYLDYAVDNTVSWGDIPDIYASIPNLRGLKLVQCVSMSNNSPTEVLEYREADDVYDSGGVLRRSVYTLRGPGLRMYPIQRTGRVEIYGYQLPVTTEAGFQSWIANDYPEEVATWASSIIHHRVGNVEQANLLLRSQVQPFKELLIETYKLEHVN